MGLGSEGEAADIGRGSRSLLEGGCSGGGKGRGNCGGEGP